MLCRMLLVVTLSAVTANRPEGNVAKGDRLEAEPEVADLSGYYTCKGQELGGKNYTGMAVITKKNDVYLIQWLIGSGSNFTGVAVRQGNTFAASWAMTGERGIVRGVNLYKIETASNGPRLVGRWATLPGPGYMQNETLTFLKKMDPDEE